MEEFIVSESKKLTKFLQAQGVGYSAILKALRKKDIKINGQRVSKDLILAKGDKVTIYIQKEKLALNVVYQDDNLVVLNKPQGIESVDFFEIVKQDFPSAIFTHRLDRNTGGLIIFALNQNSYNSLYNAIKTKTLNKYYKAMVYGKMPKKHDILVAYCKKDSQNSFVSVFADYKLGRQKMITEYSVISEQENSSILQIKLVTGRTHQIRSHLAFVGNFVLGDSKYGKESINKALNLKYQQLFACRIEFNFDKQDFLYYLNQKQISQGDKHILTSRKH